MFPPLKRHVARVTFVRFVAGMGALVSEKQLPIGKCCFAFRAFVWLIWLLCTAAGYSTNLVDNTTNIGFVLPFMLEKLFDAGKIRLALFAFVRIWVFGSAVNAIPSNVAKRGLATDTFVGQLNVELAGPLAKVQLFVTLMSVREPE